MTPPSDDDGDEVEGTLGHDIDAGGDDGGEAGEGQDATETGDATEREDTAETGDVTETQDAAETHDVTATQDTTEIHDATERRELTETQRAPVNDEGDRDRERIGNRSRDPPPTADPEDDDPDPILREVGISIVAVLLVGVYIFMISGVWPPMVAVESGSMEPNMNVNDLVFVMDDERFQPESAHGETGVVTAREGRETGYRQFGGPGDVIVFNPNGQESRTPIIHRAMFWVEDGERWVERADSAYLGGVESCEALTTCPAPNAGFITKGDNNPTYDQVGGGQFRGQAPRGEQFKPVRAEWIVGTAEVRIPRLGWLRLRFQ
jgi:signal peptidase